MGLTQEQKIDFGQCFSLVVEHFNKTNRTYDKGIIIEKSIDLFYMKQQAKKDLEKIEKGNMRLKDTIK